MLNFIDDSEFDLLDSVTCDEDGHYHWTYNDGEENHNGSIPVGYTRTIQEQTGTEPVQVGTGENGEPIFEDQPVFTDVEVDIYAKFVAKEAANEITVTRKSQQEIDAELAAKEAEEAKRIKAQAISSLTVEVDGMEFQANELSRQRMADAILASEHLGVTEHTWRLADNSQATVTITQLKQAHAEAIQAFGALILE